MENLRANRDCLQIFRRHVIESNRLEEAELDAIDAEAIEMIDSAREAAKAAPFPDPSTLTDNVYVSY